jgi:hypothetical protein
VFEQINFISTPRSTSKFQILKHMNKTHNMIIITNIFTLHKLPIPINYTLQINFFLKWKIFNLQDQEQKQELSTSKNKNSNLHPPSFLNEQKNS